MTQCPSTVVSRRTVCPQMYHPVLPLLSYETQHGYIPSQSRVSTKGTHRRGVTTSHQLSPSFGAFLDSRGTTFGSFLNDPQMVLGDVIPDILNPNMILHYFRTTHMNFTQNEHVKLDETCLDTQGHFKATLLNIMDVLGCFTSKLQKLEN